MQISPVEVFGYLASAVIAYSLTRDSIVKLRWFNLFGASSFCVYGIIIGAFPVALLNGFIALTNLFYLRKLMNRPEEHFKLVEVNRPSNYVDFFLDAHKQEIDYFFPRFQKTALLPERRYFLMTDNTNVIGILSGKENAHGIFIVDFDFVISAYRDCRVGHYVLGEGEALKHQFGFKHVGAKVDNVEHERYLEQIGMTPTRFGYWIFENKLADSSQLN